MSAFTKEWDKNFWLTTEKTFDSILIFKNYGFFSKEDKAYSLPLTMPFESKKIVILAKNNSNKVIPELTNGEIVFEKLLLYEKHSPAKVATKALMEFNKIAGPKSSNALIKIISLNIEAVNLAIIKANSLPSDHYKNSLVECLLYQRDLLEKSLESTSKLKT